MLYTKIVETSLYMHVKFTVLENTKFFRHKIHQHHSEYRAEYRSFS